MANAAFCELNAALEKSGGGREDEMTGGEERVVGMLLMITRLGKRWESEECMWEGGIIRTEIKQMIILDIIFLFLKQKGCRRGQKSL